MLRSHATSGLICITLVPRDCPWWCLRWLHSPWHAWYAHSTVVGPRPDQLGSMLIRHAVSQPLGMVSRQQTPVRAVCCKQFC